MSADEYEFIEVQVDDVVSTLGTIARLNRSSELLSDKVSEATGLTREEMNDADPAVLDRALKKAVHEIFSPEIVKSWIHHNIGSTIQFHTDTHNIHHLSEGEPIVDVEEAQSDPRIVLNTLMNQIPLVVYTGYLLGLDKAKTPEPGEKPKPKKADVRPLNQVLLSIYLNVEPKDVDKQMMEGVSPEADLKLLMATTMSEIGDSLDSTALASLHSMVAALIGQADNPETSKGNAQSMLIGLAFGLRLKGVLDGVRD